MEKLLDIDSIKQVFIDDPLLWLWLLLGVVGLVVVGVVLSWFFGKPVLKFYIDGEVKAIYPKKRGEKVEIPIGLTEYEWFVDKKLSKALDENMIVKKRVIRLYSDSLHVQGNLK